MKILLLGANGQIGSELQRSLQPLGDVVSMTRSDCDFTQLDKLSARVREEKPNLIVNAAGYTNVEKAETEKELAEQLNARLPERLAQLCHEMESRLVHFSSNYVYSGQGDKPFSEDSEPGPTTFYGNTKLAGDLAIQSYCNDFFIFRTGWVYSHEGRNILTDLLKSAKDHKSVRVCSTQVGAPTPARLVADIISTGLSRMHRRVLKVKPGIYHISTQGEASQCDFAREIFRLRKAHQSVKVIPSGERKSPVSHPVNNRLQVSKLEDSFCVCLPSWQSQLATLIQVPAQARNTES
ncbi:dTDP-4-dehydrorhamnose reductase [Aliidiomarina minuta]|uniref:dTDP-4-dehydrorhamnose reductase n=1 Tax=Aliidiomarina minuta TaxID=880057 RepID=A0A432W853_9GAMM|nr:dTDP-4-dehydrorhamnose reductase [Aliidiomarina minuta]RUO26290.1 dTDP-4-dehydrorhamnose reductase [Aliidiomarina minuta]